MFGSEAEFVSRRVADAQRMRVLSVLGVLIIVGARYIMPLQYYVKM